MEYEVKKLLGSKLYADILKITDGDADFSRFKSKTVVITGAGQLLGYYLVCAMLIGNDLYSTDISVVAVDADEGIFERYGKLTYRKDIDFIVSRDYSELISDKADFVIHTESFKKLVNNNAAINLLDFIINHSSTAVIATGSEVYGDVFNGRDRIFESDMGYCDFTKPEQGYVQAQRTAESLAVKLAGDSSANIRLARMCKVYGAMEHSEDAVCREILDNAVHGRNLVVDLKQSVPQSYSYVTDAAEALLTVLLKGAPAEIYNIASGCVASNFQIASECVRIFPKKELKLIRKGKTVPLSPMASTLRILDNTKLALLGFAPKVELREGVKRSAEIIAERSE